MLAMCDSNIYIGSQTCPRKKCILNRHPHATINFQLPLPLETIHAFLLGVIGEDFL